MFENTSIVGQGTLGNGPNADRVDPPFLGSLFFSLGNYLK